jgi:hypothetical protein
MFRSQKCFSTFLLAFFSLSPLLLVSPAAVLAQWEPDVRLTYNDSVSYPSYPNAWGIAAGPGNEVHVAWEDSRDGNSEIYTKRSTDGGVHWGSDVRLSQGPGGSIYPCIATMDSCVHLVWDDKRDGNWEIYYKRSLDYGATWSPDQRLTFTADTSLLPCLAVQGSDVHVVWGEGLEASRIWYKRSTNSGTDWSQDIPLSEDTSGSGEPSVAVFGSEVHVAWYNFAQGQIYYKRSSDSGQLWTPDTCLTNSSFWAQCPSIAVSGPLVHVVWEDWRDGNAEVYYKRSSDHGFTWGSDRRLTFDSTFSRYPSLAASGTRVHTVWHDHRDGNEEIYYKHSTDGGVTWGSDVRLTYDTSYSDLPTVAVGGAVVHVVWYDGRSGNPEIFYKRNPTGNSGVEVSSPITLSPCPLVPLSVIPNPFVSFTSVPGHSSDLFALYDISGRKAGTYRGDKVGADMTPGVYFLRPEAGSSKPLRVVKIR